MSGRINGFSLAYTAVGAVVLWSGIKGETLTDTFRGLLSGTAPALDEEPITQSSSSSGSGSSSSSSGSTASAPAGDTGAAGAGAAANQATARLLAAPYGWSTGTEWADLVSLWNRESSWDNQATNPGSGAYGIAQALGHGDGANTAGTVTNEYGGYGVSDSVAQAANSGSAAAQITWGLAYIKATYGSPESAWATEESQGAY